MERIELVEGLQRLADSMLDNAMQRGCDAFLAGRPRESNPFRSKYTPRMRDAWDRGWVDASGDVGVGNG